MIVKKTEAYTCFLPSPDKKKDSQNKLKFVEEFNKNYTNFQHVNIIIDFSNSNNNKLEEILLLYGESGNHKNNNKSFVVVCSNIDIERIPDDLIVVPTLQEAIDVIEIEEIERDLGI